MKKEETNLTERQSIDLDFDVKTPNVQIHPKIDRLKKLFLCL